MAQVIEEVRLILSDVNNNNNKFWTGKLYDDGTITTRRGRVGYEGVETPINLRGKSAFDSKVNEKYRKGYTDVKTLPQTGKIVTVNHGSGNLHEIAKKQIVRSSDPLVEKLIARMVKLNIHNITSATNITYNTASGTFQTPLGIVTLDAILDARSVLSNISDLVRKRDWSSPTFISYVNQYLRLVPQHVGMKLDVIKLFGTSQLVSDQSDILDSLEASFNACATNKPTQKEDKVFGVKMETVSSALLDKISKKYQKTIHRSHMAADYVVDVAYKVNIESMVQAFEHGKKLGNVLELWTGTKSSNLLSILHSGFRVIPPATAKITGKLYGHGVYFSDQSTKALNYSCGYWGGSKDDNPFMFLCDVAMGKMFTPSSSYYGSYPVKGYDSTFAKGGQSGVLNNEMIVYKENQINPTFLVEFRRK